MAQRNIQRIINETTIPTNYELTVGDILQLMNSTQATGRQRDFDLIHNALIVGFNAGKRCGQEYRKQMLATE